MLAHRSASLRGQLSRSVGGDSRRQVGGPALVRGWGDLSVLRRSETARTDEVQDKVRRRGASLLPLRDAAALTASGRPAGPLGRRWEEARRSGGRDRVKSGYSSCQW